VAGVWLVSWVGCPVWALPSIPGVAIENPDWAILMTPEGYSDVALDRREGFVGREYLSGEWGAAIHYAGGASPSGPIWLRGQWGFPCWTTNSNFSVLDPIGFDAPAQNGDGFARLVSRIGNGDVEITIRYEMIDTVTGIAQGEVPASDGGGGSSVTSNRYVLRQTYEVENVSGGPLSGVEMYQFLHGLESGTSVYDDRAYGGAMSAYRHDNTQRGTSRSFKSTTDEIFSHDDIVAMHAMAVPTAIECGYYGVEGVDDHIDGKPSVGVHLSVEAGSLNGVDDFDPPDERWVSGAMCFALPNLADGASASLSVLLSIRSESTLVAPAPSIEVLAVERDEDELVLDFQETTAAPLDGFVLWRSADPGAAFPEMWQQLAIPRFVDVPFVGANRFRIPIDPGVRPRDFFVVQGVVE